MSREYAKREQEETGKRFLEGAVDRPSPGALILATLNVKRDGVSGGAEIRFMLPCDSKVELKITDENLETSYLHIGVYRQGTHLLIVDGSVLNPGEYVIELRTCLGTLLRILRV